ncbi:MAG: glutamate synthase subunit alpha, partial [Hyphomicrobiales bacterium]|nr:glutamate synthase subunit alpha [Hyphomicrobiales bacterium]
MDAVKVAESELKGATSRARARKSAPPACWPNGRPPAQGLFDPAREHDSCGVGIIADMTNAKRHDIIEKGLQILLNLRHRGAVGADPKLGDGCGIMVQIPHRFFLEECAKLGFALPEPGQYAVGHFFLPNDAQAAQLCREVIEKTIADEGQVLLGFREPPVDNSDLGESVKPTEPLHLQAFIGRGKGIASDEEFERRLYILRKQISGTVYNMKENNLRSQGFYPVSISCRTVVYKGMVLASQLGAYYTDLRDARFESAFALVHQRFSTNTFPSWPLAHPFRMVAHNGEINTLRGNVNWMAARQASVDSELFGNDISKLWPISYEGQSDTACFDNALEFLVRGGYSLAHAMMMLIPEAWAGNPLMDENRRAFYEYHAALMEPWDGPASIAFSDGRQIGATLDRNGLRPARYLVTKDGLVVLASEAGVLSIPESDIVRKWRLQPGKMLLIDLEKGRIVSDDEVKTELAQRHPYRQWLKRS